MSSLKRIALFKKSFLNNYIINQARSKLKCQLYSSYNRNYDEGKYAFDGSNNSTSSNDSFRSDRLPYEKRPLTYDRNKYNKSFSNRIAPAYNSDQSENSFERSRDSFRSDRQSYERRPQIYHHNKYNQNVSNNVIPENNRPEKNHTYEKKPEVTRELIDKDDPDNFGTLSGTKLYTKKFDEDEGDKEEEEYSEIPPKPLRTKQYADMIKDHLKNKRIKEALDVVAIKMIKQDRVKPENYIFNLLIGGCARVGYTKQAFKLFNDMKKRGLKVTGGTYTSLFNACANSPFLNDGLKRATDLRELMFEKGYIPNITNYNAMIKAYGRCGDLKTAFMLVDEMIDKKLQITSSTINFLLQACISDKEAGFRHALLTWRKIRKLRKKPDTYSYNLMLRCVRDCGLGDIEATTKFFDSIPEKPVTETNESNQLMIESKQDDASTTSDSLEIVDKKELIPNLLAPVPHLGGVVAIKNITKPEDRILLLGGASGVLKQMYEDKAIPDLKTYTQLLQVLPPTNAAEIALMKMMKKTRDKIDVCFLNMLIKRRCERFDYESAKEVKNMIKASGLYPDILTYGVLAMTCRTKYDARDLLDEMLDAGYRPNSEILETMLRSACHSLSFGYVMLIMETLLEEEVKPNTSFCKCLEDFYQRCRRYDSMFATTGYCEEIKKTKRDYFETFFRKFEERYVSWKEEIEKKYPEIEQHPWQQFRKDPEEGFEESKNFERKRKIRKRFLRAIT